MIIVIADDLTGAAEMAGIAWCHHMHVEMIIYHSHTSLPHLLSAFPDVLVVATDNRSVSAQQAEINTEHIASQISDLQKHFPTLDICLYKKTDSILRGHILVELKAFMDKLGCRKAMLLAQNPSKNRIVENGIYSIDGVPLEKTIFNTDPEFPATTSNVVDLLCHHAKTNKNACISLPLHKQMEESGIYLADAVSQSDIGHQLSKASQDVMLAGGADFFEALILKTIREHQEGEKGRWEESIATELCHGSSLSKPCLIVCGSTLSKPLNLGIPVEKMPEDVFHGQSPVEKWFPVLQETYSEAHAMIITIGRKAEGGAQYAIRLRKSMAMATVEMISRICPKILVIEGGATAFAILSELKWHHFGIKQQIAPGVVTITHQDSSHTVDITLKPGSYPWGNMFKSSNENLQPNVTG